MADLPKNARVVIVGGGIVGCSVAYHLALRGCNDVVLLERKQLTCGTTWHAAGLVGQLRATHNLTRLAQYTTNLFKTLEDVTGQATGFQQRGSVAVAPNHERFEELKRGASMARVFGLDVNIITPREIAELVPLARVDDLVGGVHLPNDGVVNPIDTTQALAKGARSHGVKIFENMKVDSIIVEDGRAVGVKTTSGDGSNEKSEIRAEFVVNCAGMWARELGDAAGAIVPLHAAEHFYIVTEAVPEISPNMPVLRDPDGCGYFKEDAGKLLVGWFEPVAKPWGMKGISEEFSFTSLPEDFEHIEPLVAAATHRMPLLAKTGIRLFFNGPESFTPDDRYLLGESPDVENLFVAAGFNSIGIQSSGGAGKVLADWILDGKPPMDLWDVDVRRSMPYQRNKKYLHDRTVETLGLLYAMHWPFRQPTPLAVCANLFCTIASPNVVHVLAKSPVGSARTGLRLLVSNLSMSIHMASKTGLSIQPKNITLCATQSACLISRHSASSSCKGQMRCRYSIKFVPMKLTCRLAKLSIPSGLTKLVASKPT